MSVEFRGQPAPDLSFSDPEGRSISFAELEGQPLLVNLWATWCPPCRKEMPSLDRLEGAMGDDGFEVLVLSMDRASVGKIETFFDSIDVEHLEIYREPSLRIGTEAGVLGMPVTLVLDRQGREIARLQGEAEWDGPNAQTLLKKIVAELDASES